MTALPSHIEQHFFDTLKGDIPIPEFERWLYEDRELESLLSSNDYLELISLNFKAAGSKYELWKTLSRHIDLGKYKTYKLLEALEEAKRRTPRLPFLLGSFYDLYCHGYSFLEDLGMAFGLRVQSPVVGGHTADDWDELTTKDQERILQSFYPQLDKSLDRAIDWLRSGQILLTGETDDLGHHLFVDHRTEEQRKSDVLVTISEDPKTGSRVSKNKLWERSERAPWWQFWK